jgi:hypothetical protein
VISNILLPFFLFLEIDMFAPDNVLKFADYLYEQTDYAAAAQEYKRYQYLCDSVPESIHEKLIDCYVHCQQYDNALRETAAFTDENKSDYTRGWIFFLNGQYDSSRAYCNKVGVPHETNARHIIGLGYAYEFNWNNAGQWISLPDNRPSYKQPVLGAFCALFPGGGHFYSGRFGDGFFSFLVVSTSALLAHYYYEQDEDVKFSVALGTTVLFYAANIYGGINAVRNYNYYQNTQYLQRTLELHE